MKGNSSKQIIFDKILKTFDGAFMADEKTLRIPLVEDGTPIEIKVSLTAAKDIVGGGAVSSIAEQDSAFPPPINAAPTKNHHIEATPEEKQRVADLMAKFNL